MAITSYAQERAGSVTRVTVVSDLIGLVFYHWYVDGAYAATTTAPYHTFTLEVGEQVRIEALDTNDEAFDPIENAPAGYPARVSLWWTRSESLDAVKYRVREVSPLAGVYAEIAAPANQWSFSTLSPRLTDGALYIWQVDPIDAAGNVGTAIELIPFASFLRTPDAPRFSATYSAGTQRVTFAAA